jgi:hypothetical protein
MRGKRSSVKQDVIEFLFHLTSWHTLRQSGEAIVHGQIGWKRHYIKEA